MNESLSNDLLVIDAVECNQILESQEKGRSKCILIDTLRTQPKNADWVLVIKPNHDRHTLTLWYQKNRVPQ